MLDTWWTSTATVAIIAACVSGLHINLVGPLQLLHRRITE